MPNLMRSRKSSMPVLLLFSLVGFLMFYNMVENPITCGAGVVLWGIGVVVGVRWMGER